MQADEELKLINRIFKLFWSCIEWFEELKDGFIVNSIDSVHRALKEKIEQVFRCPFGATIGTSWSTSWNSFLATSEIRVRY